MDYEKAYKNALAKARELKNNNPSDDGIQNWVKDTFPELKESEDEGMRKFIKLCLDECLHSDIIRDYERDKCLAWLEKQGIKWNKNTEGNKPPVNHSVLMKTTHGIAEGEWQGEQWHQYRWASRVRDCDVLSWIELSELEKQGEQKPAWTDIDEKICREVMDFVLLRRDLNDQICGDGTDVKVVLEWLDTLKGRIGG